MNTVMALAKAVAAKDLRTEFRSRVVTNQVLPFAGVVLLLFAFAIDSDSTLARVSSGLVWMTTLFSMLLVTQRSFDLETADGALDALRVAGADMRGVFIGKSGALIVQLLALDVVLFFLAVILFRVEPPAAGLGLLVVTTVLAAATLGLIGVTYGGLAAKAKGRETLLPLLILPVVAPVVIAATRATESALGVGGRKVSEGWPWTGLLGFTAIAFAVVGLFAFPALVEE